MISNYKADPGQEYEGTTPIQLAVKYQYVSIVGKLCRRKVNLSVVDSEGKTPLHVSIQKRNFEISDLLLNFGAPLNVQDKSGDTPIHTAVRLLKDTQDTMLLLAILNSKQISFEALDAQTTSGDTALMIAVKRNLGHAVDLLIKKNANPRLLSSSGMAAINIAHSLKSQKIIEKLENYLTTYQSPKTTLYGNVNNSTNSISSLKVHDDYEALQKFQLYLQQMLDPKTGYERIYEEYDEIEQITYDEVSNGNYTSALLPENNWKNRYKNILPCI